MAQRFLNPQPQFLKPDGSPILDGFLNFYENGTEIRKDTFADVNLTAPKNPNPVPLNPDGTVPNIFYDGTARVILTYGAGQRFDLGSVGDSGSEAALDIWSSVVEYSEGALVEASDDEYYRSLQSSNLGNDPTSSPVFWEQVQFLRLWNANINYSLGDLILGSDGKLYSSLQNSNLNKDPISEPTWWELQNPFDQSLNKTDSPTFVNLTITSMAANWTNAGRTIADLGTVTTVDINGGTMDGVVIGSATPAAISGTTGTFSGAISFPSIATNWTNVGRTVADMGVVSTIDINGGTIDGTTIGASTPAAATVTTFTSTGIDDNAVSTAVTIDASNRVIIGHTSAVQGNKLEIIGINGSVAAGLFRYDASTTSAQFEFRKSRGAIATHGLLLDGDELGKVSFTGSTGAAWKNTGEILARLDGTVNATSLPTALDFYVTPTGSTVKVIGMTLNPDGSLDVDGNIIGSTDTVSVSASTSIVHDTHANRIVESTAAGAVTMTVNSTTGTYQAGDVVVFAQSGAGQITVAAGAGYTMRTPANRAATARVQYSQVSITFISATEFIIGGDLTVV